MRSTLSRQGILGLVTGCLLAVASLLLAPAAALASGAGPKGINIGFDFDWGPAGEPAGATASFVATVSPSGATLNNCSGPTVNSSTQACDFAFAYSIGGVAQPGATSGGVYETWTSANVCDSNPSNSAPLTLWHCFNTNSFGQIFMASATGRLTSFTMPMTCLNPAGTPPTGLTAVIYQVTGGGSTIPATPLAVAAVDLSACPTLTDWTGHTFSAADFGQISLPFSGVTLTAGNFYAVYFAGAVVPGIPLPANLSVTLAGNGLGTVTSSPAGINCGATCSGIFDTGKATVLTASAAAGSVFTGWSGGGCSGTGLCVITPNPTATVTATFSIRTVAHDFNGDGFSDILWLDSSHDVGMWLMKGSQLLKGVVFSSVASQWSVVGQRDFNGDGFADILWRDTSGNVGMWLMNGTTITQAGSFGSIPAQWSVAGTGDFNGDGKADILWVDTSGNLGIWFMNGITIASTAVVGQLPANWVVVGSDMKGDVFLRNTSSGDVGMWVMSGGHVAQAVDLGQVPLSWTIAGIGDFDSNGSTDILWRDPTGAVAVWLMNGLSVQSSTTIGIVDVAANWTVAQTGDYNGDGISDILWVDTAGDVAIWSMLNGLNISSASLGNVGTIWKVQSLGAD